MVGRNAQTEGKYILGKVNREVKEAWVKENRAEQVQSPPSKWLTHVKNHLFSL